MAAERKVKPTPVVVRLPTPPMTPVMLKRVPASLPMVLSVSRVMAPDQVLLMPLSLTDWLPAEHLAWTVLEAVSEMNLSAFYGAYRAGGHGRAYEPWFMGRCSCTRTRAGIVLRVGSSGRVLRMSPTG